MSPELRNRLNDIIAGYVSSKNLYWQENDLRMVSGFEPWTVSVVCSLYRGTSWFPDTILAEVLDLVESHNFASVALANREVRGNETSWIYEAYCDAIYRRDQHINSFEGARFPSSYYKPTLVSAEAAWKRIAKRNK